MERRRAFLPLAMLLALALSGSALAQHQGRGRGGQQQQQQQQQEARRPMMPPSQGAREASFRERQAQRQPGNRMSDEERRQLRRDISDHGRDIYTERQGQQRR